MGVACFFFFCFVNSVFFLWVVFRHMECHMQVSVSLLSKHYLPGHSTLNVHKTFRRHPWRLTNALTYPFTNFPAPYIPSSQKWIYIKEESFHLKNDCISKKWIYIKEESVHSKLKILLFYFPSELNFKIKAAMSKIGGTNKYPCKTYSAVVFVCFRHTHLP